MNKKQILDAIQRTARDNGGVPLGVRAFFATTGIKASVWRGKYWARWGDAVKEAGLVPNTKQVAYKNEMLLAKLAELARELGHFPTRDEIRLKSYEPGGFPSDKTFARLGSKRDLQLQVLAYCKAHPGMEDVIQFCIEAERSPPDGEDESDMPDEGEDGFVYLLKSGRNYKIGRSNAFGRRERELAIQLPEKADTVHVIRTDDPSGIEAYWHKRFSTKRKNGEWFELSAADIKVFRRRKFM